MPVGGANPLPQIMTIATTVNNTALNFTRRQHRHGRQLAVDSGQQQLLQHPYQFAVSVQNAEHTSSRHLRRRDHRLPGLDSAMSLNIPVTLNVEPSGAFFNNLPGGLSFSLVETALAVQQTIAINNGGSGTLNWTATPTTADGKAWLVRPQPAELRRRKSTSASRRRTCRKAASSPETTPARCSSRLERTRPPCRSTSPSPPTASIKSIRSASPCPPAAPLRCRRF